MSQYSLLRPKQLIVVAGPTAVGKTAMAIALARAFNTEIINADARQFYRELTIGTAKPSPEELSAATHHFVNSLSIQQHYNAAQFEKDALAIADRLFTQYDRVLLAGGSGMYIKAVCEGFSEIPEVPENVRQALMEEFLQNGLAPLLKELQTYDPEYFKVVDRANHRRVIRALEVIRHTQQPFSKFRQPPLKQRPFGIIKIALSLPRELLYERINQRVDQMISRGLFEEAAALHPLAHLNALNTVGYQEIFGYIEGKYDRQEAVRLLKRNTRRYAKRQLTWLRSDPGFAWFAPDQTSEIIDFIKSHT